MQSVNEKPNVQCCTVLYCIAEHKTLAVIARRKDALTFECNDPGPGRPLKHRQFSLSRIWRLPVEWMQPPRVLRFLSLASFRSIIIAQALIIQSYLHLHHPSCPFIVGFISFQRCPILRLCFNSIFTYLDTRRPVSDSLGASNIGGLTLNPWHCLQATLSSRPFAAAFTVQARRKETSVSNIMGK